MRKFLLLLALFFPSLAAAQNSQYFGIVLGPTGKPLAGARVTFCSNTAEIAIPCTTTINLFDYQGNLISNPQISDGKGNVNVWAPVGVYLMTVSGTGVTPYKVVVNFPGGGGGGGSGTVGPGTPNQLAKFITSVSVGDSSCTDTGTGPTRCPNGMNTAAGGDYDEYTVDTAGVVQGKLVCRSAVRKVKICPAGTTNGVLGVALATATSGQTATICWKDCNVIVANTTTTGDWLIPSASIDGDADSVGVTRPLSGIVNFLAESSATSGNAVHSPMLSLDTLGGTSAVGTVGPCPQFGSTYYTAPGTSNVLGCITPPAVNGNYVIHYPVSTSAALAPQADLTGLPTRIVSGTSDTLGYNDRVGCVKYTSNSAVAVTLPQAGTTPFTSNYVFCAYVAGNGAVTITPVVSTLTTYNNSTTTLGPLVLSKGQWVTIHSPDNVNWEARIPGSGAAAGYTTVQNSGVSVTQRSTLNFIPAGTAGVNCADNSGSARTDCTISAPNGAPSPSALLTDLNFSYTMLNSDNQVLHSFVAPGTVNVTLPQAASITIAPLVTQHTYTASACTACTTTAAALLSSHMNYVFVAYGGSVTATSVTDTAGNIYTKVAPDVTDPLGNGTAWRAVNTIANAANVITINFSGVTGNVFILQSEYNIQATDNAGSAQGINGQVAIPISYPNAVAIGSFINAGGGCPIGWVFRQSLGLGDFVTCDRILNGSGSSLFFPPGVTTSAVYQSDYAIGGIGSFLNGWWTMVENATTTLSPIIVTPTTSLINGRTTLVIHPNETCTIMSDGTNYNAWCGFTPNQKTNGVVGGSITIDATPQTAGTASIGATTIMTTPSTPVSMFKMSGYAEVTVVGSACAGNTTVVLNAIFTSPAASSTTTLPLGTFTITTNGTVGTSNFSYPASYFRAKGSTAIQFSTTYTAGGSCSPAPTVQVTPVLQTN